MKLEGIGGVTEIESDVIPHARALVEYWPPGWPLGLFARWEGAFDNLFDQHFAVAGFRLYLESMRSESPLTLRETDRLYFRESCVHFLLFARTC